jgi:glycosyltransferase involved in cell wall biosynthesis
MAGVDLAARIYRVLPWSGLEPHLRGGDCLVLHDDPPILYVRDWVLEHQSGALLPLFRRHRDAPVHLLMGFSWCRENAWHVANLAAWRARHLRRHPRHRVVMMANSVSQHDAYLRAGLDSAFINHNAFVDPAIFRPLPGVEKRFDAVYDARLLPFKRHYLAAGIDSLALIVSRLDRLHDEDHSRRVREQLGHAHWYNDPLAPDYRLLDRREINARLNECRVGLCLSAEEGAMKASIQYLLAGLPVVSTPSLGGRDVFFDPDYTRVVEDRPEAIAEAVRALCACPVPAATIRARTLLKMEAHRQRLFELLDQLTAGGGRRVDWQARWQAWIAEDLGDLVAPAAVLARLEQARRWSDDAGRRDS